MSRRIDRRPQIAQRRQTFVDLRWRAAIAGVSLSRQARFLGAIYLLTSFDRPAELFYSLDEVEHHLDRLEPSSAP